MPSDWRGWEGFTVESEGLRRGVQAMSCTPLLIERTHSLAVTGLDARPAVAFAQFALALERA